MDWIRDLYHLLTDLPVLIKWGGYVPLTAIVFTETGLLDEAIRNIVNRTGVTPDEARRRLAGMSPQQRLIQPDEIARLVSFLVSEEAGGINGQAINIDGGAVTA